MTLLHQLPKMQSLLSSSQLKVDWKTRLRPFQPLQQWVSTRVTLQQQMKTWMTMLRHVQAPHQKKVRDDWMTMLHHFQPSAPLLVVCVADSQILLFSLPAWMTLQQHMMTWMTMLRHFQASHQNVLDDWMTMLRHIQPSALLLVVCVADFLMTSSLETTFDVAPPFSCGLL